MHLLGLAYLYGNKGAIFKTRLNSRSRSDVLPLEPQTVQRPPLPEHHTCACLNMKKTLAVPGYDDDGVARWTDPITRR